MIITSFNLNINANLQSLLLCRTSKEISDLEGELLSMRNLLNTQAAMVQKLSEGILDDSMTTGNDDDSDDDISDLASSEFSKIDNWMSEFSDNLEVLLAEKRVDEALAALDEGEFLAKEYHERHKLSLNSLLKLKASITEQRVKLADQLAETTCQPSTRGAELRSAVTAMKRLGDGPRAHTLLLDSHQETLQRSMKSLRSSNARRGAYAVALSQLVFSTIAQVSNDSMAVFGEDNAYTSELVTWAVKQAESLAILLKRQILASSSAGGGLRTAAECLHVSLGLCSLLEARGLALSPVILRHLRSCVEKALTSSLKRIEQSSVAAAAAEDWVLNYSPGVMRPGSASLGAVGCQPILSRSAYKFNSLVQVMITLPSSYFISSVLSNY